uniref:Xylulose kinase-1 n=1 Tax=Tanacetum cinerariifolium TaxID=118510 RepID=A0A6L2N6C5_TANCI|nr:xylulose kinase-1 [Tanacetum cinerariifolium]
MLREREGMRASVMCVVCVVCKSVFQRERAGFKRKEKGEETLTLSSLISGAAPAKIRRTHRRCHHHTTPSSPPSITDPLDPVQHLQQSPPSPPSPPPTAAAAAAATTPPTADTTPTFIINIISIIEHVAVQRETKARTLLLQSLLEDHMADFHHLDDAREIWLAVKARFGGNEESKKMRKTMLKREFSEFSVFEEEGLHKGYDRALPPLWSQVALTLKTRGGLEYLSFDDFYNKLRSLEIDVKGKSSYGLRENKTEEGEQVYGLMARFKSDFADHAGNAAGSVSDAAAEFAMMGISSKWKVKLVESLARFDKWKESSKNLVKLINSSMSTRTKLSLGFKECIGSDEVFDLSTPSVFDPEPKTREVKSLYERFVKAGEMHEVPPSIIGTF